MAHDFSTDRLGALLARLNEGAELRLGAAEDLFSAGALDSLRLIQFVMLLEEEYGFQFDYQDIQFDSFRSLEAISQLLRKSYN